MDECKVVSTPMNQKEKFIKEDGVDKVDEGYNMSLIGCLDSDWAGSYDDMKSTSGYCFNLCSAQSTTETEFITTTVVVNQVLWLKKILCDLHF